MNNHLKNVVLVSLLTTLLVACSSKEEYVKVRTTDLKIL